MIKKSYVQYGCGICAPSEWKNFDVSPTLRIQKIPLLGSMLKGLLNTTFPKNVHYGNIIKGLPVTESSCDGVYCSHTLEHLSLEDFRKALANTYRILKPGGTFRCVVPDLEYSARKYIASLDNNEPRASFTFLEQTLLGSLRREYGLKGFILKYFSNRHHLWMWDKQSLALELLNAGFKDIRVCSFNDSTDAMFNLVEDSGRFENAVAIESKK